MAKLPKGFVPFEKGAKDKGMDAKKGAPKEGSKGDMKADAKGKKPIFEKGKMPVFKKGGMAKRGC
jgi:hypothetical protein